MTLYQRQTVVFWGIAASVLGCGVALWWFALRLSPILVALTAWFGGMGLLMLWRALCQVSVTWPDVAAEQMRELERRLMSDRGDLSIGRSAGLERNE